MQDRQPGGSPDLPLGLRGSHTCSPRVSLLSQAQEHGGALCPPHTADVPVLLTQQKLPTRKQWSKGHVCEQQVTCRPPASVESAAQGPGRLPWGLRALPCVSSLLKHLFPPLSFSILLDEEGHIKITGL